MKGKIYLAYGLNVNIRQMAKLCPTAKYMGTAFIEGYKLVFRGEHGSAFASIEPDKEGKVPAVLWEIQPADEEWLDNFEGFPFLYGKEDVEVDFNGNQTTAMAYFMKEGRPLNSPSIYYKDIMSEGYRNAGFDEQYLTECIKKSSQKKRRRTT